MGARGMPHLAMGVGMVCRPSSPPSSLPRLLLPQIGEAERDAGWMSHTLRHVAAKKNCGPLWTLIFWVLKINYFL
jgi:hypothetical protein